MGGILRHKKTGGLYEVLFRGAQIYIHDDASLADDDLVTVYQVPGDQIAVVPLGATVDNYVSYLHSARTQTATGLICGDEVVVYRNVVNGRVWVRPTSEMDDGRFEPAQAIEARQGGDAEGGSVEDKSAVAAGDVPASKSEDQPPSSTPGEVERPHAYSTPLDLDRLSKLVGNDDLGERLARAITDARQFHELLPTLSHISTAGRGEGAGDLAALSAAAEPGMLALSPQQYDDWGMIRTTRPSPEGFCWPIFRAVILDDDAEQSAARAERRQPKIVKANSDFLVRLWNDYRSGRLVERSAADATNPQDQE